MSTQATTTSEQIETVRMNNQGEETTHEYSNKIDMHEGLLKAGMQETRVHDIKNFLARPILLETFSWTTASTVGTMLRNYHSPKVLTDRLMVKQKLSGFYGLRGDVVLTLQINGTRFQQGLLMLNYVPLNQSTAARRTAVSVSNMIYNSQLPHIVCDVSTDTEVSLVAPFVYNDLFYVPYSTNAPKNLGIFQLLVYSPLIAPTGDTNLSVTVWAHMENVQLEYPTMIAQGLPDKIFRDEGEGDPIWEAQGPRRSKGGKETAAQSVADRELEQSGVGPISGFFGKVSRSTAILAQIPLLSSVAGPASWVSNILSGSASAVGWSKPTQNGPFTRVQPNRLAMMANTNGIDNSVKLAADVDNQIEVLPGFGGTDNDELHITRFVQRWSYFLRTSWTTSSTSLGFIQVNPVTFSQLLTRPVTGKVAIGLRHNTPLSYVATMFKLWRGSINLRIRVVKTEFHSGRLAIVWIPHNGGNTLPTGSTDGCYKEIFDIREKNIIEFCIPYVSAAPWSSTLDTDSIGHIQIQVINQLRAPANVSSTVDLVFEVAGGDDMQFAAPSNDSEPPIDIVATAQGLPDYVWEAQGMDTSAHSAECADKCGNVEELVACTTSSDDKMFSARFCTGEAITSLRQLGKRACLWFTDSISAGAVTYINPFAVTVPRYAEATGPTFNTYVDYFSKIGVCFALHRGGVRMKMFARNNGDTDLMIRGLVFPPSSAIYLPGGQSSARGFTEAVYPMKGSMTGGVEIEIPQYWNTHSRVNVWSSGTFSENVAAANPSGASPGMGVQTHANNTTTTLVHNFRQMADDTDFGVFIGVMPTVTNWNAYSTDAYT